MMIISKGELRRRVETALGRSLREAQWDAAVREGAVQQALRAPNIHMAMLQLVGLFREGGAEEQTGEATRTREVHANARHEALAEIIALEAHQSEAVQRFRREVLRGRLIVRERIPDWLRRRERKQGKPTTMIRIPLRDSGEPELDEAAISKGQVSDRWIPTLRYWRHWNRPKPTQVWVSLRIGSELWRLKDLAEGLASTYQWRFSEAIDFILSDEVPRLRLGSASTRKGAMPGLDRIEMSVDTKMTKAEVAQLFDQQRRLWVSDEELPQRTKSISQKRAKLAAFAAAQNDGRVWADALGLWNQRHQRWAYRGRNPVKQFTRDAHKAYKRVTGVKLDWQRDRGQHR